MVEVVTTRVHVHVQVGGAHLILVVLDAHLQDLKESKQILDSINVDSVE